MASNTLFTPNPNGTVSITTSGANQRVSLGIPTTNLLPFQVRIKNVDSTNVAFVEFGTSTVVASTSTSMPVGPGETVGITLGPTQTFAAAIGGAGTPIVYFTPGQGT